MGDHRVKKKTEYRPTARETEKLTEQERALQRCFDVKGSKRSTEKVMTSFLLELRTDLIGTEKKDPNKVYIMYL